MDTKTFTSPQRQMESLHPRYVPKLCQSEMYKFLMYTLLQNNFTVLSTETIAEIGATITTHNEQFFKDHKVGAPK